jgi:FkbM family methyltransferase
MGLKNFVNAASSLFGFKVSRAVSSFGNKFARYGINKHDYVIAGDKITFHKLNVTVLYGKAYPILEEYEVAVNLYKKAGTRFFTDADDNVNIEIDNITFIINDREELYILSEIFLEGSYNLLSPVNKKIALIDIGMNVGITSLFYASKKEVQKVFSFEPFLPTYNLALNNIKLNKSFSEKMQVNNFGLAREEGKMTIPYSLKEKGRMGLNGVPAKSAIANLGVTQQDIFLKPVAPEFDKIKAQVNANFVVCKMDCEGAEYEIIDSLFTSGLLSLPDVYFIEWHHKSPEGIISNLVKCNYNVIGTTFKGKNLGMIYAIKTNT